MYVGDNMDILNILADFHGWCNEQGVRDAFHMIRIAIEAIRLAVPIGLIIMTTLDVTKKVINPDEKDGQKKIMTRLVAAVVVFLLPVIITITLKLVDAGLGNNGNVEGESKSNLSSCWRS